MFWHQKVANLLIMDVGIRMIILEGDLKQTLMMIQSSDKWMISGLEQLHQFLQNLLSILI